jgi:TonB family protein
MVPPAPQSPHTSALSLTSTFGVAALVVILGVMAAWITLRNLGGELELGLSTNVASPEHRNLVLTARTPESLLERAELAFAAGRIVEPEFDSALSFYKAALEQDPSNAEAVDGVGRIVSYLLSQAESALFQNDWDAARRLATVVLDLQRGNARAADVIARADRFQRVQRFMDQAVAQFSAGRLAAPDGDNAAASYRAILALDADNAAARQGLAAVAQRLVANAHSAALAGDVNQARRFIAQARAVEPRAPGLAEVEAIAMQGTQAAEDLRLQRDLVAASEALQEDRLMPPATPNAFELFSGVLTRSPGSEPAQRGIRLIQAALVDRTRTLLAAGNIEASHAAFTDAQKVGVSGEILDALRSEIAHQERFADARLGRFERVYSIADLDVIRQVAPEYPRLAAQRGLAGWVILEFTVTQTGEVRDPRVTESSSSIFDRAAIAAIDRWLFEPVVEDGRTVPVRASIRFAFRGDS